MLLKTKEFQEAANAILLATGLDKNVANLELVTREGSLYLNVTNKEFYVSVKFDLEQMENFRAVVEAKLFLNLISGITTEDFGLNVKNNTVVVTSGKSNYKLPMIYENDKLMALPTITVTNKTVEMDISNDILASILNINSKELIKAKNLDINELQRLYFIDETGCFTFTTGACLNSFSLEKPIKLLLNDRIVKLFKLFKEDVHFSFGHDILPDGIMQTKAIFETNNIYVAAIVTCDDLLVSKIQAPCDATKHYINTSYANQLVVSSNVLSAAISRLILFTKNSSDKNTSIYMPVKFTLSNNEITITDKQENCEVVQIENGSFIDNEYEMELNLTDLKFILDSCKNEHITINCGNHKSVVINRGPVSNVIPEGKS